MKEQQLQGVVVRRFYTLLSLLALTGKVRSFQSSAVPMTAALRVRRTTTRTTKTTTTTIWESSNNEPINKRKRRKRKVVLESTESAGPPVEEPVKSDDALPLQPRDRSGVSMRVQNIMSSSNPTAVDGDDADQRATRPTYIPRGESEIQDLVSNYATTSPGDDPLARILLDAKAMDGSRKSDSGDDTQSGVMIKVQNVISTIVTVDFFVVCALLVWFLVGIGASAVAKNDAIQIAFNNIFEPVVQPALGILMIASISDAVLKPKEDDEIKL